MRSINQTLRPGKTTAINLAKIIHRAIITIDFRVSHTVIIIIDLISFNLIIFIRKSVNRQTIIPHH
jgi:hypothetical protein